jgi:diguanylate cyclase (GGDEF)-like protein/PAS domain S-box-containing protein
VAVSDHFAPADESEQRRLLVESAHNGMLVVDTAGTIECANAEAERIFGYPRGALCGRPVSELSCTALGDDRGSSEPAEFDDPIITTLAGRSVTATARAANGTTVAVKVRSRPLATQRGHLALLTVESVSASTGLAERACPLTEPAERSAPIADTSPNIGRWRFDLASQRLWWSDEVYHTYGLPVGEEPTVERAIAGYDAADRARITSYFQNAVSSGTPYRSEARIVRPDGSTRSVVHGGRAERSPDGTIVAISGYFQDITEHKNVERERHRLSEYVEIANAAGKVGTWELDLRTNIAAWDRNMYSLYGIDDVSTVPTFALWNAALHPHDRERAVREVNSDIAGGVPSDSEFRVIWQNGEVHHIRSLATLVRDAAGAPVRVIGTDWDVTELRLLSRQLREEKEALVSSEARYRALTEALPQLVLVVDSADGFEYVNQRWSAYTGLSLEESRAAGIAGVVDPADVAALRAAREALPPREFECEARLRCGDESFRWHVGRGVPFAETIGEARKWIVTATDIEERKSAEKTLAVTVAQLEHRVHHDAMTDLPNRMLLMDRLAQAMTLANRAHTGVIVLYVDLDRFKAINDTFGHTAGDHVLKETGLRIVATLRAGDTASRVGGDEFIVVCATGGCGDDVPHIATRLLKAVTAPIDVGGEFVNVEASIGVSIYPADGFDADTLIRKADAAMYSAKQDGRNTYRRYSNEAHISIVAAAELEAELRHAIATDELVVHYQPIVDLRAKRPTGAEALVRWQHPRRGLLMPADFIPFAEERGLVAQIGDVVLRAACAMLERLKRLGHDGVNVAVNVSAHQFGKTGFVDGIVAALAVHDTDPRRLTIEITESVVMGNTRATLATLDELKELGVSLSIDDFGTGYSSLAYVKNFPVNSLKIDRSFVRDIAADATDAAIAKTIITLAHSLGMRVIAEGVETEAQLATLRAFGADGMQGYLFSRAVPGPDFERFLTTFAQPGAAGILRALPHAEQRTG